MAKYKGPKLKDLRGTKRQKRIEDLLSDASTRRHVPTKDLPSNLRKERVKNARLDAPFVAGSDVTHRDVARDREATLRLAFDPEERELARQRTDSLTRERTAGDYFAAYQQDLKAAVAQQAQDAERFGQIAKGIGDAGQSADTAQAKDLQTQAEADAKARGATADPEELQRAAQASQVRRSETDRFGALMATQAQSASQSLGARAANVPPLMDLQNRKREGDVRSRLQEDTLALSRKKGDARLKYMTERRDAESKRGLERLLFEAETADKAADNALARTKAKTAEQNTKFNQGNTAADNRRADEQARAAREKDDYQREHGLGPYKPAKPTGGETAVQKRKRQRDAEAFRTRITTARDQAAAALRTKNIPIGDPKNPTGMRAPTEQEVRAVLLEKYKDSVIVNAAMELRKRGRLNPGTAEKIRKRGAGVPKAWKGKPIDPATKKAGQALGDLLG